MSERLMSIRRRARSSSRATQLGPATVFLSGNDQAAKSDVAGLLRDLGWSDDGIVDLGGIESARGAEHYFVLFGQLADALGTMQFNIRLVQRAVPARFLQAMTRSSRHRRHSRARWLASNPSTPCASSA